MELILKRPKKHELATLSDMAQLLVKAVPARARSQAYTLLMEQILPKKLGKLTTHPDPSDLVETTYESLACALEQARPNERLQALRAVLCDAEIRQLDIESLTLAVARYIKEHPSATKIAHNWLGTRDASKWLAMSNAELQSEALKRLEQLKRWEKFAQANHPDVWENYRIRSMHIDLNLRAAYSGIFQTAMGNLAYFLDTVGASYNELRLF